MDFFEILPVHPQPQPNESLCSYMTRLVEANRLGSSGRLYRLFFPDLRPTGDYIVDLPPRSLGAMSTVLVCPESRLWAATYYYLGQRLLNQVDPNVVGSFLNGSLVPYQRYCPACLAEHGYYQLVWRFHGLPGCPQHQCYLLDRCGQCGTAIPLISVPPRLGVCPTCQTRLETCATMPLSELDRDITPVRFHELVALLAPSDDHEPNMGTQFTLRREQCGLSIAYVARLLGLRHDTVQAMENYGNRHKPRFEHYLNYAAVLSLTLRDLFAPPPHDPDWTDRVVRATQPRRNLLAEEANLREATMLARAEVAAHQLLAAGEKVTNRALAKRLSTSTTDMRCYPRLAALADRYQQQREQQRRQQREAEVVALIREKVEDSLEDHHPLSLMKIGRLIGVSTTTIQRYSKSHQYAQRLIEESLRPQRLADERLMHHMQATADRLRAEGKPVNRETFRAEDIVLFRLRLTAQSRPLFYSLIQEPLPTRSAQKA